MTLCVGYLIFQSLLLISLDRKTPYYRQNLIGDDHFLSLNKQKLLGMCIVLNITTISRKCRVEVTSK